jgi:hypothetical protein|tara:strand:+ start:168 stop:824 length:657 start_codon:yes stop_codon:yes gene_type:complete
MTQTTSFTILDLPAAAVTVSRDEMRDMLIDWAILRVRDGLPSDATLIAEYSINMLLPSKLRAAAKFKFSKGLIHHCRKTLNVGYDYDRKVKVRGGKGATGGATWQQAVVVPNPYGDGDIITPLTIHQKDVLAKDTKGYIFAADTAWYLRCETLTHAQRDAGFGRSDYDYYADSNAESIDFSDVKPFFYHRTKQLVKHRTISSPNIKVVTFKGSTYLLV